MEPQKGPSCSDSENLNVSQGGGPSCPVLEPKTLGALGTDPFC